MFICRKDNFHIHVHSNTLNLLTAQYNKRTFLLYLQLYRVTLGHMEGEIEKVALLITSHAVYILTPAPGDVKYTVHSTVQFQHIDYLSVRLLKISSPSFEKINILCVVPQGILYMVYIWYIYAVVTHIFRSVRCWKKIALANRSSGS